MTMPSGTNRNVFANSAVVFATTDKLKMDASTLAAGGGGDGGGGLGAKAAGGGATYASGSVRRVPGGHDPSGTPKMKSDASSSSS
jgi:hypothetical protein